MLPIRRELYVSDGGGRADGPTGAIMCGAGHMHCVRELQMHTQLKDGIGETEQRYSARKCQPAIVAAELCTHRGTKGLRALCSMLAVCVKQPLQTEK